MRVCSGGAFSLMLAPAGTALRCLVNIAMLDTFQRALSRLRIEMEKSKRRHRAHAARSPWEWAD